MKHPIKKIFIISFSILVVIACTFFFVSYPIKKEPNLDQEPLVSNQVQSEKALNTKENKIISLKNLNHLTDEDLDKSGSNSSMERYFELSRIALLRRVDQAEMQSYLSDPKLLHDAMTKISQVKEKSFISENEVKRIEAIKFIEASLEWNENPIKEHIVEGVIEIIRSDLLDESLDVRLLKSLAGDRVQLFHILLRKSPEKLARAVKNIDNQRLLRIYKFALDLSKG